MYGAQARYNDIPGITIVNDQQFFAAQQKLQ